MTAAKIQILPLRRTSPPTTSSSDESPPESHSNGSNSTLNQRIPKQKRTSKPKVRSGCVTCKIRRVKCDETKPSCDRCTSTGRKCDGYAIKPRKKRSNPKLNKAPDPITEIGPLELRALDFFHHKTAPALSSYFDAEFWTRLVFQMSYVEPAIRHAMVALGALHEVREQTVRSVPTMPAVCGSHELSSNETSNDSRVTNDDDRFGLAQYGRALTELTRRMDSDSSIEVVLLACILFVCVEFLRGDSQPAVAHFNSGMGIVLDSLATNGSHLAKGTTERVREHLLPFLNRIELLSNLFGNESTWDYPIDLHDAVPCKFKDIKEARDSVVHLCNLSIRFIRTMKFRRYERTVRPQDHKRRSALLNQLEVWTETLDKLLLADTVSQRDLDAAKTLRIHQMVAAMWVKRSIFPEECSSDEGMADYETAVSLAEAIQGLFGTREQRFASHSSTFLFDMEIVSPMYYIATRCRHPVIRRRAIAVLEQTHRREGLWDSNRAAAAAKRIVEIEEVNMVAFDGSELPREEKRIHNAHIDSEVGTNPKSTVVTFSKLPCGLDGPWVAWKEVITLA